MELGAKAPIFTLRGIATALELRGVAAATIPGSASGHPMIAAPGSRGTARGASPSVLGDVLAECVGPQANVQECPGYCFRIVRTAGNHCSSSETRILQVYQACKRQPLRIVMASCHHRTAAAAAGVVRKPWLSRRRSRRVYSTDVDQDSECS